MCVAVQPRMINVEVSWSHACYRPRQAQGETSRNVASTCGEHSLRAAHLPCPVPRDFQLSKSAGSGLPPPLDDYMFDEISYICSEPIIVMWNATAALRSLP